MIPLAIRPLSLNTHERSRVLSGQGAAPPTHSTALGKFDAHLVSDPRTFMNLSGWMCGKNVVVGGGVFAAAQGPKKHAHDVFSRGTG